LFLEWKPIQTPHICQSCIATKHHRIEY